MKTFCLLVGLIVHFPALVDARTTVPLRLVETIPLPNVKGRIDHMDVDVRGGRLFVAGLENGSVEVVDLRAGKWVKSIPGFQKPQGIAYLESLNKLFVASGDDGMLRVFRGDTLRLLDSIKLDLGPNRVAFDPRMNLLYVGYGGKDAGKATARLGSSTAKLTGVLTTCKSSLTLLSYCSTALEIFSSSSFLPKAKSKSSVQKVEKSYPSGPSAASGTAMAPLMRKLSGCSLGLGLRRR